VHDMPEWAVLHHREASGCQFCSGHADDVGVVTLRFHADVDHVGRDDGGDDARGSDADGQRVRPDRTLPPLVGPWLDPRLRRRLHRGLERFCPARNGTAVGAARRCAGQRDGQLDESVAGGTSSAYQFTALKHTMLFRCRSPLGFLLEHWREPSSAPPARHIGVTLANPAEMPPQPASPHDPHSLLLDSVGRGRHLRGVRRQSTRRHSLTPVGAGGAGAGEAFRVGVFYEPGESFVISGRSAHPAVALRLWTKRAQLSVQAG